MARRSNATLQSLSGRAASGTVAFSCDLEFRAESRAQPGLQSRTTKVDDCEPRIPEIRKS